MSPRKPRIIAHRGAWGRDPENSLAAFREAIRRGADGVELDAHATADGHLVVYHDEDIPGLGSIAGLSADSIRRARLANGEPIPRLEEALAILTGTEVWIELKRLPESADHQLLAVIGGSPSPKRCAVHSFDHRIVARLGTIAPGLRRGVLSASYPLDPIGPMIAAGAGTLWQEWHLIDPELVDAVHRQGGEIIAWTVRNAEAAQWLAGYGVDAWCGDFPEMQEPAKMR